MNVLNAAAQCSADSWQEVVGIVGLAVCATIAFVAWRLTGGRFDGEKHR